MIVGLFLEPGSYISKQCWLTIYIMDSMASHGGTGACYVHYESTALMHAAAEGIF